jgi:hypothetical protein
MRFITAPCGAFRTSFGGSAAATVATSRRVPFLMSGNVSLRNQTGNQAIVPGLLPQQNQIINGFMRKMWFGAIENLHKMGKSAG